MHVQVSSDDDAATVSHSISNSSNAHQSVASSSRTRTVIMDEDGRDIDAMNIAEGFPHYTHYTHPPGVTSAGKAHVMSFADLSAQTGWSPKDTMDRLVEADTCRDRGRDTGRTVLESEQSSSIDQHRL